ncbi:MAG: NAD(P)-dependent oxidoreductase [Acidimicrobiales bacterium]
MTGIVSTPTRSATTIGWLGCGRMGAAMARRLIDAGHDVTVWNRTRSKAEDLMAAGARVAESVGDLGDRDVVFVMVATPSDLADVMIGTEGLLKAAVVPRVIVSCSTVDVATSQLVREAANERGVQFLASPISGNPHVVAEGGSTLVASGPHATYELVAPLLDTIAKRSVWVGEGEVSLLVKICHNLYLGVMVQALVEVTTLAEKSGVSRRAFLEFLNSTDISNKWVEKRTPDLLALDWTPTFTTQLLRKDVDIGLSAAKSVEVPMPLAASLYQILQASISFGHRDEDFLSLFALQAASANLDAQPE